MKNYRFDDQRTNKNYELAICSDIGKRETQQDCAYMAANDRNVLAVVCDGMGGMAGGALASGTAVNEFIKYYVNNITSKKNQWMLEAVETVDNRVYELVGDNGHRIGAGTTLVAVTINDNFLNWVGVGDSRIYIFRDGQMVQVTTDHNYYWELNQKYQYGKINYQKYSQEAENGEVLISFIGMGGLSLIDNNDDAFLLREDDVILLCTDGVYKTVPDEILKNIVEKTKDINETKKWIQDYINAFGEKWQDNYTYILIKINGEDKNE